MIPSSPNVENNVIALAARLGKTIALAESCTGGLIAHLVTNVSGASAVLNRGWVVYSDAAKIEELGVQASTLKQHGAVSARTALEMARGALERSGADFALAVTGIAGPSGGSAGKPVGTVFFGLANRQDPEEIVVEHHLTPQRTAFKEEAAQIALNLLLDALSS
ncbi:MAG: CinA family protein [bacterium]